MKTKLANEIRRRIEPVVINRGMALGFRFLERRDLMLILEEWKLDMAGLVQGDAGGGPINTYSSMDTTSPGPASPENPGASNTPPVESPNR